MKGTVVLTGVDAHFNRTFGIWMHNVLFSADAEEVLLRGLNPEDPVIFITNPETGKAEIVHPAKIIGCERVEG